MKLLHLKQLIRSQILLLHQLDQVLARCLFCSLPNLVIVNHTIGKVHDLKVLKRLVHLIEIPEDIWNRTWSVPLTWILIVNQAHSCNVLDRKNTLWPISVVIHHLQDSDIGASLLNEAFHGVFSLEGMPQDAMSCKHLRDPYCAAPADIIVQADFYLAALRLVQVWQSEEHFNLFDVTLEKRLEVSPIAKVHQSSKATLEAISSDFKSVLLWEKLAARKSLRSRHAEFLVQQHDREVWGACNFNESIRAEHFEHHVKDASSFHDPTSFLHVISCLVCLSFQVVSSLVFLSNLD